MEFFAPGILIFYTFLNFEDPKVIFWFDFDFKKETKFFSMKRNYFLIEFFVDFLFFFSSVGQ